jgi:hypothetical protein
MSEERKYPRKKDHDLSESTKAAIRSRLAEGNLDTYQIAREVGCSESQVAGIKAAITKGQDGSRRG